MSFFTNLRADRLIVQIKSTTDLMSPETQKAIGKLKDAAERQAAIAKVAGLKDQVKSAEEKARAAEAQLQPLLIQRQDGIEIDGDIFQLRAAPIFAGIFAEIFQVNHAASVRLAKNSSLRDAAKNNTVQPTNTIDSINGLVGRG